jgi:tetratricopeptide (TPR) repeat protein
MRLLFLALTIIGITPCMAQRGTLDSLLPRLKRTKEDTIKVNLYIDIAYAYFFIRTDSSYYSAQLGEGLSGQLNFPQGLAITISQESAVMTIEGNYPRALSLGLKALRIADEAGDPLAECDALNSVGTLYFYQHDYRQALTYYLKSIPVSTDTKFDRRRGRALTNTGDAYQAMG